ncbi:retrovirus-related Pol polyprotein from transposon 17.6 [Trichonephila clavipes]|uniref:Retrovirus-related Pol polyprotein from transposon 17.6 n=1 Tax=Trichonephila clavipes TaxID=2585209 RepID=A0A8X6SE13_TRICX|nr:retrovirus-related Pol polyprotein from transposon 17.6 [Trichonephila clavipes]
MTTLDLRSRYFQLVNSEDIPKTALVTKSEFTAMSFGLSREATNIQKTIDIILKPVTGKFVCVSMDDVTIASQLFEHHVQHLREVFRLLQKAGLKLKQNKCCFTWEKFKNLALVIRDAGVKTDESKIKCILERKFPKNAREVSKFLDIMRCCQVIYSQFGLAIHENDHQARRRFVEWAQNEIAVVPDFHKRILFSDEAHFWLNGYINKQNCRIWSEANPQVYVETPLRPEKLTVWCALWAGGIIGLYFFKNDEGHNVTVNGDRYRAMITNFFIPELNNHDVKELWFQQDGATCHTARASIDLLKDTFGERLISRFGPVN